MLKILKKKQMAYGDLMKTYWDLMVYIILYNDT